LRARAAKLEAALREIAGFVDEMADFNKEAVTIARAALEPGADAEKETSKPGGARMGRDWWI
jgi:hypothetical protein